MLIVTRVLHSPAKVGAIDWFASSGYEYMWHLEDDTLTPDFAAFTEPYSADRPTMHASAIREGVSVLPPYFNVSKWELERARTRKVGIAASGSTRASCAANAALVAFARLRRPFWTAGMWRIGDQKHALRQGTPNHINPAAMRLSKGYARMVLDTIIRSEHVSHHEVFLLYTLALPQGRCSQFVQLMESSRFHFTYNDGSYVNCSRDARRHATVVAAANGERQNTYLCGNPFTVVPYGAITHPAKSRRGAQRGPG